MTGINAPVRPGRSHGPHRTRSVDHHSKRAGYLFLTPWMVGLVGFTVGPFLFSLALSFTDFDLFRDPHWIGADNYIRMFTSDPRFITALVVTLTYVMISVPMSMVLGLLVALAVARTDKSSVVYRALFYVPSLLGGSVAVALLWRQVFGADGLVNAALSLVGISGPSWISDPDYSIWSLIALNAWQFGIPMVLFIAGIKQIPGELYEAAKVDGAGAVRRFFSITLPMLTPVTLLVLIFQTINAFQAFTQAFIISGGTGGPSDSTLFYTLYIYQEAFSHFRMGYASALAWVLMTMTAVVSAVIFATSRWWVHYAND